MTLRITASLRYLVPPELGEPTLPGVLDAGAEPLCGDVGAVVDAPVPVLVLVLVEVSVDAPALAPSASFLALRSARLSLPVSLSIGLSAPVLALSVAVASPRDVALGLVTGDAPSAFELSGRAPPVSTLRPWDLSWVLSP